MGRSSCLKALYREWPDGERRMEDRQANTSRSPALKGEPPLGRTQRVRRTLQRREYCRAFENGGSASGGEKVSHLSARTRPDAS